MTTNTTPKTFDLKTVEGNIAWAKTLPTKNLKEIAARQIFLSPSGGNFLQVTVAQAELILRGEVG